MAQEIKDLFKSLNYIITEEEYQHSLEFFSDQRCEVRSLIEKLSWNETVENQMNAINALATELLPCEYIYLVLPDKYTVSVIDNDIKYYKQGTGKSRWENAAKTIITLGWPKVDNIIVPLFIWLLDPNWPGSDLIHNFLISLPQNVLTSKIKYILENPQNYDVRDYNDLKELIQEILDNKTGDGSLEGQGDGSPVPSSNLNNL